MKVGIVTSVLQRKESGVEVYLRSLMQNLPMRSDDDFFAISPNEGEEFPAKFKKIILNSDQGKIRKYIWEFFDVGIRTPRDLDVIHGPNFSIPMVTKGNSKLVSTVHDLAFERFPDFYPALARNYFKFSTYNAAKKADAIICISDSCYDDFRKFAPNYPLKKLYKIYQGYNDFSKIDADNSILDKMKIEKNLFFLFVGALNPRKNLDKTIRSFLASKIPASIDLVITGSVSETMILKFKGQSRIKFTGHINRQELSALYRSTICLVFPSFFEGFGFPALEALSVGTAVLASNSGSLPQITAIPSSSMLNPYDEEDIRKKMEMAYFSEIFRNELSGIGMDNLKNFSWVKCAKETYEVYEQISRK